MFKDHIKSTSRGHGSWLARLQGRVSAIDVLWPEVGEMLESRLGRTMNTSFIFVLFTPLLCNKSIISYRKRLTRVLVLRKDELNSHIFMDI